jgi:hypothetical protein
MASGRLPGNFEACPGTFDGKLTVHLGQTRHDVKEKTLGRCAGVDRVRQAFELNSLLALISHHIDQVLDAPPESIKLPDDKGVAFAQGLLGLRPARPFRATAADLVFNSNIFLQPALAKASVCNSGFWGCVETRA